MKSAFVQPASPWQGKCQLCSSDTICEGDSGELRQGNPKEEQHRKAKARTKTLLGRSSQQNRVCWFSLQHQLTEMGLSPPNCRSFTETLK